MSDYARIREQFPGDAVRVYGQPCGLKICVTRTLADAAQITVPYLVTYNEMGDDARMQVVCARIRLMVDHEARYYEAGGMSVSMEMANGSSIVGHPLDNPGFTENHAAWGASPIGRRRADVGRIIGHPASHVWVVGAERLEVDYARDLDDAPTFTEALAALEAHKARRGEVWR